jgi:hypothetical protein
MAVAKAFVSQNLLEDITVELGLRARARKRANINNPLDMRSLDQREKFID